jgi:UDP-N-acetylglucosamine--N-acetylmuramyl-(pentapeptide) pyrophosphoryl-undecaprenol N-acetylglucosamine transferase
VSDRDKELHEVPTIFFAGGGTGGHLFPALAIAEHIRAQRPDAHCVFLCSQRPIDAQILGAAEVDFEAIPAQPFSVRPAALARFVWRWGGAVRSVRGALARRRAAPGRAQSVMVAMGGFVAAPAAQAARAERMPLLLINLDAIPGKANRWIARRAQVRLTAADGKCPKHWERIAPIVRASAVASESPAQCREKLGLDAQTPTLLVTGGSQGAGSINALMLAILQSDADALRGWQVIHQTGAGADPAIEGAYCSAGVRALTQPFFDTMGLAWKAADLAVTRCGAGAVAEAWANHTPCLFLPYPYHRDEHQRWNAQPLADRGGAIIERDLIEPGHNLAQAGALLRALLGDQPRLRAMAASMARLGPANGAETAAGRILGLLR